MEATPIAAARGAGVDHKRPLQPRDIPRFRDRDARVSPIEGFLVGFVVPDEQHGLSAAAYSIVEAPFGRP